MDNRTIHYVRYRGRAYRIWLGRPGKRLRIDRERHGEWRRIRSDGDEARAVVRAFPSAHSMVDGGRPRTLIPRKSVQGRKLRLWGWLKALAGKAFRRK